MMNDDESQRKLREEREERERAGTEEQERVEAEEQEKLTKLREEKVRTDREERERQEREKQARLNERFVYTVSGSSEQVGGDGGFKLTDATHKESSLSISQCGKTAIFDHQTSFWCLFNKKQHFWGQPLFWA